MLTLCVVLWGRAAVAAAAATSVAAVVGLDCSGAGVWGRGECPLFRMVPTCVLKGNNCLVICINAEAVLLRFRIEWHHMHLYVDVFLVFFVARAGCSCMPMSGFCEERPKYKTEAGRQAGLCRDRRGRLLACKVTAD